MCALSDYGRFYFVHHALKYCLRESNTKVSNQHVELSCPTNVDCLPQGAAMATFSVVGLNRRSAVSWLDQCVMLKRTKVILRMPTQNMRSGWASIICASKELVADCRIQYLPHTVSLRSFSRLHCSTCPFRVAMNWVWW